jgi:uncharacterized protein YcfJ
MTTMRRILMAGGLGVALAVSTVAVQAQASCQSRKATGTVIGGVAGGLLGNAVTHGGGRLGGTLIGAGVGAVAGHEIAKSGCSHYASRRHATHYAQNYPPEPYAPTGYASDTAYRNSACHYETRPYYNQAGQLVYAPTQVCQ